MGKNIAKVSTTFYFCDGGSCQKAGSDQATRSARAHLRNEGNWDAAHTIKTRCNGRCEDAPTCIVQPGNYWYKNLNPKKVVEIVESHVTQNKPVQDYLLFKENDPKVDSEKERGEFALAPFELKDDPQLGMCYLTKGFSSDQYLYPLFLYLQKYPADTAIRLTDDSFVEWKDVVEVKFDDAYRVDLLTSVKTISFNIAPIPLNNPELRDKKISKTEYYCCSDNRNTGIRFSNKFGEVLAIITLGHESNKAWQYCQDIQLQNLTVPSLTSAN